MTERNFEKVDNNNYLVIQGWMIKELGLKGKELLIYACVYGFSQHRGNYFTGSLQYLADWTASSIETSRTALNKLLDKDLILKYKYNNNVKYTVNYEKLPIANFVGYNNKGTENW